MPGNLFNEISVQFNCLLKEKKINTIVMMTYCIIALPKFSHGIT